MTTLPLKSSHNEQRAVIRFLWAEDLMQMRFTLSCVYCMVTSILRGQQYMFGVRSVLAAEKALLMRNDLDGARCCDTDGTIAAVDTFVRSERRCQFQTLFGTPVFHKIQCTKLSTIISSLEGVDPQQDIYPQHRVSLNM